MVAEPKPDWWEDGLDVLKALMGIRLLTLVPLDLRQPGTEHAMINETGRNFVSPLEKLCRNPTRKADLISWVRQLTPTDIDDLDFIPDPDGNMHLQVRQGGSTFGVRNISDGTLRFLVFLAACLSTENNTYFVDEIETGLHPSRIELLIRLIEKRIEGNKLQVIATTHSPEVLDRIHDRTFEDSSVLARIPGHEATSVHRLAELPEAPRLRKEGRMGEQLRNLWMETVLYFLDDDQEVPIARPERAIS